MLLGAIFILLMAPGGFANGGSFSPETETSKKEAPPLGKETPPLGSESPGCLTLEKSPEDLDLEGVTMLIIQDNNALEKLTFSNLEKLTTLVIKNNNRLTKFTVPHLAYLENLRIENNDKLGKVELSNFDSHHQRPWWRWQGLVSFETDPVLTIKGNNCLGELNLVNLNNLKELRIEGNDNLKTVCLRSGSTGPPCPS